MTTPKLVATQHCFVESLAGFTFSLEYQRGRDIAVADSMSHVTTKLVTDVVKSIMDGVTTGTAGMADAHDSAVTEADERINKQVEEPAVQAGAIHMHVNLHVMDWVAVQQEDPYSKL